MDIPQNLLHLVLLGAWSLFSFFVGFMTFSISAHRKNSSKKSESIDTPLSFDERILSMVNLVIGKDTIRIEHIVNEGYYALWVVPSQTDLRTLTASNSIRISRNLFNKINEIINEFRLKEKEKEVAQRHNDRVLKG